jgi:hypothetical protein
MLVVDAVVILRTPDPSPSWYPRSGQNVPTSLFSKMSYCGKQVATALLLYTPSTLEEPMDGKEALPVGVVGTKLKSAVGNLETTARIGRNADALSLLAAMKFIYFSLPGVFSARELMYCHPA